ncbi:flagellar hook assembly protein FlgD [Stutzerimonas kirkiae]|uniref:Basal-body rod modification protein FlgD n=1 Tax=Stutzerimonas kirkiae TaxID=2211392 RepID=A0A4Q9RE67_9GAMM|nr:flagellar hook assembly protein FlgD [Stutzerimonas kirkiae]TBU99978.1 flagellar biosynthesis protein FlgD [Stutzerimonas kirkiae]TBV05684.1 flagellar biosynthesis protein FlgD [Stutzerimonas kirkiae]TBV10573.1 flagellar biosynthesis protein FlgD [Stutzerimonas kirkiae]TBV17431.1 flagellar biosynthesis protein FlgD [Stutzerimonas kirkiae]
MSTTDSVSSSVLSQYSGTTTSTTNESGYGSLGKDDFLMLLVTQLNNQNPLDPQDNSEFVAQLAQFSSLESMTNLNTSMDTLVSSYQSSQALQASSLVGRSVIISSDNTYVETGTEMTGSVVIPSAADAISVKVYSAAGNLVKSIPLDSQSSSGTVDFTWDGTNDSGEQLASGTYTFKASATLDGTSTALTTYLPATVSSVTIGGSELSLNLAGAGSLSLSKVISIGQ